MLKRRTVLYFFFLFQVEINRKTNLATLYFYMRWPSTVEPVLFLFCTDGEDLATGKFYYGPGLRAFRTRVSKVRKRLCDQAGRRRNFSSTVVRALTPKGL